MASMSSFIDAATALGVPWIREFGTAQWFVDDETVALSQKFGRSDENAEKHASFRNAMLVPLSQVAGATNAPRLTTGDYFVLIPSVFKNACSLAGRPRKSLSSTSGSTVRPRAMTF